ncbi:helix-turn-helix transcriptional regulator [Bordetella avium]|uniref:helix-turn-helix transcriptional regulator n=1 Tax=Bordetella avium TaxID=521 RepID=UPI0039FB9181
MTTQHPPTTSRRARPRPTTLQPEALYSWKDIEPFVSVGRETWRRKVNAGEAPQAIVMSPRCTRYSGREVLAWLESPTTYRAPQNGGK